MELDEAKITFLTWFLFADSITFINPKAFTSIPSLGSSWNIRDELFAA